MSLLRVDQLSPTDDSVTIDVEDIYSAAVGVPASDVKMASPDNRSLAQWAGDFDSVKKYGVIGDGITDDTAAFQKALNTSGGGLYIPANTTIYLKSKVTLPNKNFRLFGLGPTSIITGTASTLVAFGSSNADANGSYYTIEIVGVYFQSSTTSAVMLDMTSVWDAGGKKPHRIRNCRFTSGAADIKCIKMRGVWSALIEQNDFNSTLGSGKTSNGGYGVFINVSDNMNTCVMNTLIQNNTFLSVPYPVYVTGRTVQNGGRVEGVKFQNNNVIQAATACYFDQVLALAVEDNQISDCSLGLYLKACFQWVIGGNTEITADTYPIYLDSASYGFNEYGSIIGNNIQNQTTGGAGISITNNVGDQLIRNLTITGNTIAASTASTTTFGIALGGSSAVSNINVSGNVFIGHQIGFNFGIALTCPNVRVRNNIYNSTVSGFVAVNIPDRTSVPTYYQYIKTGTRTTQASETSISVDVTGAGFTAKPVSASMQLTTQPAVRLVYSYDNSNTTTLYFTVIGTSVAQTDRWVLEASGFSPLGF
ncbi:glycosyl hydrolase family 28-related protein [Chimaeribacter arupi]|uniref:glycosyl hydrolase family 28-related protein n=1 Tax=Chimaeribacter arupi TaxID=2060066 RepID=UPI000C7E01F0|nr:glycosyl hydrolase family 28-related protein [Chimaeribacter arupi]PLR52427.1 hypothetical protein CYR52_07670 [Chimaeribacter arupi]